MCWPHCFCRPFVIFAGCLDRTQRAAVASRRATNWAIIANSHPSPSIYAFTRRGRWGPMLMLFILPKFSEWAVSYQWMGCVLPYQLTDIERGQCWRWLISVNLLFCDRKWKGTLYVLTVPGTCIVHRLYINLPAHKMGQYKYITYSLRLCALCNQHGQEDEVETRNKPP